MIVGYLTKYGKPKLFTFHLSIVEFVVAIL
jgi:hypothetical protein